MTAEKKNQAAEEKLLNEKLAAVGRLAGGVSHDLSNMLTPILAYGNMVLEDLPPDSPLREYMNEIVKAGERAQAMSKVLQSLRVKASGLSMVSINAAVSSQLDTMRAGLAPPFKLDEQLNDEAGMVMTEVGAIEKIVDELVRNSIDAMPAGGAVTVSTNVQSEGGQKFVVLTVKDQGAGLAPEIREHIGEPYLTSKPKGQGKGLGLASVFSTAMRTGGFVRFTSEMGAGTEFSIYLNPAPS